jgi:hypothetical protein
MAFATTPIAIDMNISGLRFERIPRLTRVGKELQRGNAGFREIIVRGPGVCKCMFFAHERRSLIGSGSNPTSAIISAKRRTFFAAKGSFIG